MTDQLEPALTPEQWAEFENGERDVGDLVCEHEEGTLVIPNGDKHAAAAMLLCRQPFGFTWEDVDAIEVLYRRLIAQPEPLGQELAAALERVHDHVGRLALLLPPR